MAGANPNAWNNWYHVCGGTYGTWLRGDDRGFRTFHHREHVDGDYKNPPPPGIYAPLFEVNKRKLRYPPVILSRQQRLILCQALVEKMLADEVEVLAMAVARLHFHLLARFPVLDEQEQRRLAATLIRDGRDPSPRHFLGLARREGTATLTEHDLRPPGEVWAKRPKCDPIRDRPHQVNVFVYVLRHVYEDAVVYCYRDGYRYRWSDG